MYLLFDIGGTKTRLAVSRDLETFEEPHVLETSQDYEEGLEAFLREAIKLVGDDELLAVAGGAPGPFDAENPTKHFGGPNLPDWNEKPFLDQVAKSLGAEVFFENDAALIGLGEAHFGAGKDAEIMVYMTVSTGVGGSRIVDGEIDRSVKGFEPGHQVIDPTRLLCKDCSGPTLEEHVSGSAVLHRFGKRAEDFAQDDPMWQDLAAWLAIGVNNSIVHWSPDVFVLGGSMIVGDPAISVDAVQKEFLSMEPIISSPKIVKAELGDHGGLYGAMALLEQHGKE